MLSEGTTSKTGDQLSPPGGYVGGGTQMITDLAISPSGDVWVMDNWQNRDSCFGKPVPSFLQLASIRLWLRVNESTP